MLKSNRLQVFLTNTTTAIKYRVLAFFSQNEKEIQQLKQKITDKTIEIDRALAQRYPAFQQQAKQAKIWYKQQIVEQQANPDRPLLVDQKYLSLSKRMEELGHNVSEIEREVRSKITAKLRSEAPK